MSKQMPSIPKGTRDFGPEQMVKRNFIFSTIKKTFEKFGFAPLETPSMENLEVLTGKYGDEGDKLLYKILNSGDFFKGIVTFKDYDSKSILPKIAGKGLRYDLTVPFARYVVMNQGTLAFPFRRYQIQPVWRADRPQKGRYREFYQCDADVVGTNSLICEAEIVLMIDESLVNLGIDDFTIKINNRKILTGVTEIMGEKGRETAFCVAIDKLDKIGKENVQKELLENGFQSTSIEKMGPFLNLRGDNSAILKNLKTLLKQSEIGLTGVAEVEDVLSVLNDFGYEKENVKVDLTLARGLTYYTGCIFEVLANNSGITSSISGGGRYDDLTGVFGLEGVSGVGISFGIERIYDVMEEKELFPVENLSTTKIMIVNFDESSRNYSLGILKKLRDNDISSEIYPDIVKIKKQMNYANKKQIPFVLMVGSKEIENQKFGLKNMATGEQRDISIEQVIEQMKPSMT